MKKILVAILALFLVACQQSAPNKELSILSPTGAPAVALIPELLKEENSIELVSGPENLQAALVNENQEYDVIIAPLNLGVNLMSQQKTKYRLHSLVTWGNLFVVQRNEDVKKVAAFGEMAVPGLIFKNVQENLPFEAEVVWVPSISEAQALLLSDQVDAALLAQPLVAATMGRANQEGIELSVVSNVQTLYNEKNGVESYPQAALFVSENVSQSDVNQLVNSMVDYTNHVTDNEDQFITDVDSLSTEKLGIPSGELVYNVFDQMGIDVVLASDKVDEMTKFLELFNLELSEDSIIK